jgi:diguanylate cyclase (GGDEF)-like protein
MDEAFRRAERSADWEARARALRRSGQEELARAWVAAAARSVAPRAAEVLAAEYPLDRDALALLRVLLEASPESGALEAARAADILLGDGDPRLVGPALQWLNEVAAYERARGRTVTAMLRRLEGLSGQHARRVAILLAEGGWGLDRAHLLPHELYDVATWVLEAQGDQAALRLRLAGLYGQAEGLAERDALLEVSRGAEAEVRDRVAFVERGRAGGLPSGRPWRPSWVRPVHRETTTLALNRGALRLRGGSPLGIGLPDPPEVPQVTWVALCDLDYFMTLNDRYGHERGDLVLAQVTELLQGVFGDRVVRYGGDEWLVLYEFPDAPEQMQLALEAVCGDPRLTEEVGGVAFSAGLARRSGSGALDIQRVDEALYASKREGRGRLTIAPDPILGGA